MNAKSEHQFRDAMGSAADSLGALADDLKPYLRGWLHLGMVPLSLVASVTLFAVAEGSAARWSVVVFSVTAVLLFTTSAIYHRGHWSSRTVKVLRRLDHANIFLIIAGTHTPFAVLLLPAEQRNVLLGVIWGGALLGVAFRVFWLGAPRWLTTLTYVALGWMAVFFMVPFWRHGGPAIVVLLAAGGMLYTLGALVYARKRPNPSPRWFGFHEVFHALTVAAFGAHWTAALLAVLSVR